MLRSIRKPNTFHLTLSLSLFLSRSKYTYFPVAKVERRVAEKVSLYAPTYLLGRKMMKNFVSGTKIEANKNIGRKGGQEENDTSESRRWIIMNKFQHHSPS